MIARQNLLSRVTGIAACFTVGALCVFAQRVAGVTYVDQPSGITVAKYVETWPALRIYADDLSNGRIREVRRKLEMRCRAKDVSDGELNLFAQLTWKQGDLAEADRAVRRALAMNPRNSLNTFQEALTCFAHLRQANGLLEKWTWHRRTYDAYATTLAIDRTNVAARYYLAYSYMNTPVLLGGSKWKALQLADDGVAMGEKEFYPVRADAHRLLGQREAAAKDYDTAISLKVIKVGGLIDAARDAMEHGEMERAKKYLDFAALCRQDLAVVYEALGDYYMRLHNTAAAKKNYQIAAQKSDFDLASGANAAGSAERKLRALR
jgi:Tfp pilus assembly protein PilF